MTGSQFNDQKVTLTTTVPADYATPAWTTYWWQIQYNFTSGTVTDRTTWSVNILDLPVHLVP